MDLEKGKSEEQVSSTSGFSLPGGVKGPVRRQRRLEGALPTSSEQMRSNVGESPAAPPPTRAEGPTLLPAPYVLKGELGRGGMGIVYRAFDPTRDADVAFKFLPDGGSENQVARRFQREANELAAMSHPNIVAFYGAGNHEGRDYLIMELVEGGNLHTRLHGHKLPPVEAAHLFSQIAEGLAHIHDQGLVHRDFKPENILLTPEGVPKITDFGLARRMEERSRLTSAGAIIGTYSYLAPEQIISSGVGPAADLYAFGCCLYEALAGRPIFSADSEFALLNSHLREVPVTLRSIDPAIPAELDALVIKLVKKVPEERLASAHEVAKVLRAYVAKQVPSAPSGGEWSGTIGRQDVLKNLEERCMKVAAGEGVSALLTAPNGLGRSVVVRELIASLRAKGLKVLTAMPQHGVQLPLRDVYMGLGGDVVSFDCRLHHGGPRAAVLALRDALHRYTQPVIIVADDFHRMTPTTDQMLQSLAALEPPKGKGWLLSCASARASSLNVWQGSQHVELPPLSPDKILFLAEKELGGPVDKSLRDWLITRAGGSVRRLRLYIYALQCGPSIGQKNGNWNWLDNVAPPANYVEPILSGLSQGTDSDLKLLRSAFLTEEPFPFEVASTAAGLSEDEADLSIERLCRRGLLEQAWGGTGEHYYVASLEVKEAVLRGLADRSRKRLHSRIAEALGRRADPGLLGRHQFQAQQGPDCLAHLTEGASKLSHRGAFQEASELWQLAHQVVQTIELPELRWRVERGTLEALWRGGHLEEALVLADSLTQLPAPTAPEALAYYRWIQALQIRLGWLNGQPAQDIERRCELLESQALTQASSDQVWLYLTHAEALEALGKKTEAAQVLESLAQMEPEQLPSAVFLFRGRLLRTLNRFREAMTPVQAALDRTDCLSVDELYGLRWELAECHLGLKDVASAMNVVDDALRNCLADQEKDWESHFWVLRGRCCEVAGDWDDATQSFQDAVECSRGQNTRLAESLVALGHHQLVRRQLPQAEATLREVLQNTQVERFSVQASLGLGIACLLADRLDEAHEWLSQACGVGATAAALLLQAEVARLQSNSARVTELLEKVNPHLRPVTLELGMALTLKGLLGHPVDRGRVLELLVDAPSLTINDSLRSIRTDWLERVRGMVPAVLEPTRTPRPPADPKLAKEAPLQMVGRSTTLIEDRPHAVCLGPTPQARTPERPTPEPVALPQEPIKRAVETEAEPVIAPGRSAILKAAGVLGAVGVLAIVLGIAHKFPSTPAATTSPTPTVAQTATATPTSSPTPKVVPVVLDSLPEKAEIRLFDAAGKEVCNGTTPLTCPPELAPGDYQARISKPGYLAGQFDFRLDPGQQHAKTFSLEQLGRLHLQFASHPVNLLVDDEKVRVTAPVLEKEIRAGRHHLVISAEGYEDRTLDIEVEPGKTTDLPVIALVETVASVDVDTQPGGAKLTLNGKKVPRQGGSYRLSKLKPGQHELKFELDGYDTQTVKLNLGTGRNHPRVFTLHKSAELPPPVERPRPQPRYYNPPPQPRPQPRPRGPIAVPDSI